LSVTKPQSHNKSPSPQLQLTNTNKAVSYTEITLPTRLCSPALQNNTLSLLLEKSKEITSWRGYFNVTIKYGCILRDTQLSAFYQKFPFKNTYTCYNNTDYKAVGGLTE